MKVPPLALYAELKLMRLERDLTWVALAAELEAVTGFKIAARTLNFVCKYAKEDTRTNERTTFKVERYLEWARAQRFARRPTGSASPPLPAPGAADGERPKRTRPTARPAPEPLPRAARRHSRRPNTH